MQVSCRYFSVEARNAAKSNWDMRSEGSTTLTVLFHRTYILTCLKGSRQRCVCATPTPFTSSLSNLLFFAPPPFFIPSRTLPFFLPTQPVFLLFGFKPLFYYILLLFIFSSLLSLVGCCPPAPPTWLCVLRCESFYQH